MCEPVSATILGIAGLGMSVAGQYQQTKAQNKMADYQAQVAKNNAQIALQEGDYAQQVAEQNAAKERQDSRQFTGKQLAAQSASGAVVGQGSFQDVVVDAAVQHELNAMALLHEGDMAAWRAKNTASGYESQAAMSKASKQNPMATAGATLLSGAGQIGANYYNMKTGTKAAAKT